MSFSRHSRGGMNRVTASRASAPKQSFTLHRGSSLHMQRSLISAQEMEENFERHEDGGRWFRTLLVGFIVIILVGLGYMKYNLEYRVHLPSAYSESSSRDTPLVDPIAKKYYDQLAVSIGERQTLFDNSLSAKERRRERYRLRKAARQSYEGHLKHHHALLHCGRDCEGRHKQIELAFQNINQKFDRNLYDVLGISKKEAIDLHKLKKRYEDLTNHVSEENDEDRAIELEELRDAFDVLSDANSRNFYNLYGLRPPDEMKHTSARFGGWGQEYSNARSVHMRIAMEILKYVDSYWLDLGVLAACLFFVAVAMWVKYPELVELAERMEEHEQRVLQMNRKDQ